jgi:RsiW-degrading membrane proteinase PrsW (M82 family)
VAMIPLAVSLFLPESVLGGPHLPKDSTFHWVYAGLSAAGFLTLLLISIRSPDAGPLLLLLVGVFTGTVGIVVLLVLQALAFWAAEVRIRGRGIVVLFLLLVKFIGLMYYFALSADSSFWTSVYGFTLGVGLCEELCKLAPVIWYLQNNRGASWKGACLVGLASGIGFGVSEGIHYAGGLYNGFTSWEMYVVRFVSCVALHAAWTATIACTMYRRSDLGGADDLWQILLAVATWIGIPVVLHGMYDTLLKHDLHGWALLTALLTIGWMALSVERAARSTA